LDVTLFGLVTDAALGSQLDRVAALWIRENVNRPAETPIEVWASEQPAPDPSFIALVTPEWQQTLGIRYLATTGPDGKTPRHPRTTLIHAEDSLDRAYAIAETLEQKVGFGFPYSAILAEQRSFQTSDALWFERVLQDWDKSISVQALISGDNTTVAALKMLRAEAMKLSRALEKVPSRPPAPATEAKKGTARRTKSLIHVGIRLAAESLAWLAREHPDARTRREQYAKLRECPAYEGLKRPGFDSWSRYCGEVKRHARAHPDEKADVVE
jgi:hypothetical protein